MNINYSLALPKAAYGIAYVNVHSWQETYNGLLPDDYLENRIKNIDKKVMSTKEFIENFDGKYYVAKDEDKVIGILAIKEKDESYGYLEALYVLKEYQGYGVGRELFKISINDFIGMGKNNMTLECMVGNKTIDFYKKYDGVIVKRENYKINEEISVPVDMVNFNNLIEIRDKYNLNRKKNYLI